MITDTKAGQTNYCPNCEDQARRIEELERQNRMLIFSCRVALAAIADASPCQDERCKQEQTEELKIAETELTNAINATPSHSAAWEWNQHVEWMKTLPVYAWDAEGEIVRSDANDYPFDVCIANGCVPTYAIPELKEVKE